MSHSSLGFVRALSGLVLSVCLVLGSKGQELGSPSNAPNTRRISVAATASKGRVFPNEAEIIQRFIEAESKQREALNQHTFKRDVVLQTIGPDGRVNGEYVRNSQFLFDDKGRRIEHVLYHPASTIREMRITREDIQDLAGSQLLGIDVAEIDKYQFKVAGNETLTSRDVIAIDVTPAIQPNPHRMAERFFVGRLWIDPVTFHVVKTEGFVEPQGKQRFPRFETWREPINSTLVFPARTLADDILHFPSRDVHYRISVRYYDYKLYACQVSVKEIDDLQPNQ